MENIEIINALGNLIKNQVKKNNLNIDVAFNNFLQKIKAECRESTIFYYNKKFILLKQTLLNMGIKNLENINKITYNKLILSLKNNNYKNCTINKVCDLLKGIFKVNVDLEFIQYNPLAGIKKLKEDIPIIKIVEKSTKEKKEIFYISFFISIFLNLNIITIFNSCKYRTKFKFQSNYLIY